jgi:hypothetical protein
MLALQLGLALALLLICGFAPGFFLVRRLRWSPMEKLCGSVGASFILVYLAFGLIYHLNSVGEMPSKLLALVSVASFCLAIAIRRDVVRLFRSFRVRQAVVALVFLLVWTLVILAMIRNYSGAGWYGDWLQHFQRSLFFLHHFPASDPIYYGDQLPSRPPAMNELAAFFMGQTADRFEIFQLIFSFLNLLMFWPCCLIIPVLVGSRKGFFGQASLRPSAVGSGQASRARTSVWPLVALFALNPVVMQNITYTWTKAFTAFYVVLGLWFYLAGWRKNDKLRMTFAFVALSAGLLVHYSAAPYLLFLTVHYLLCVFPQRSGRWREVATIAVVCGLLLATWFGWSIAVYGMHGTFASNTSVTLSHQYAGNNLVKMAANLVDSIVPIVFRNPSLLDYFKNQGLVGAIRDGVFISYQTNLIFSMGLVGGPFILWLLYRVLFGRFRSSSERSFLLAMIPFCVVVGIASVGERDPLGTAHLTLLSLEILGLSLLAAMFPLRRILLALVFAGCLFDFSLGIFLHARIESLENTPQKTIFPSLSVMIGKQPSPVRAQESLSEAAWANWVLKHQYALLGELSQSPDLDPTVGRAQVKKSLGDDEVYWHGWYGRHHGAIGFLGDHIAGESEMATTILSCLLVLLAFGLTGLLWRTSTATVAEVGRVPFPHFEDRRPTASAR